MKHKILFFFSVFILLNLFGQAQDSTQQRVSLPPQRVLSTHPLSLLYGSMKWSSEFKLGFEQVLGSRKSIYISGSYLGHSFLEDAFGSDPYLVKNYSGFRTQIGLRFYRSKEYYAPDGFYIGPLFSFAYLETSSNYNSYSHKEYLSNANANLMFGYQAILAEAFSFEFFTGFGVKNYTSKQRDSVLGSSDTEKLNLKFSLGMTFGIVL